MLQLNARRYVVQMFNYSLLVGVVAWIAMVIHAAQTLRQAAALRMYEVTFGPLSLTTMSKEVVHGGQSVRFDLGVDLLWYVAFWISLGIFCGLAWTYYAYKTTRD